jgi:hypothetical protein
MHPLTILHREMRALIDLLAFEGAKPTPDMAALTSIRMKLTGASRRRAILLEEALDEARKGGKPGDLALLEKVVAATREARLKSGAHIGKWTLRAIENDWAGYCRDSADVRTAMMRQLHFEANTLSQWLSARTAN